MRDFRELNVWEKSHALTLEVYIATKAFPREEIYGLTSQIRRASVSIPANIAEGCCRNSDADFARFLQMAAGSASELEYLFLLAHEIGILHSPMYEKLAIDVVEVKRMLTTFMQKLRSEC